MWRKILDTITVISFILSLSITTTLIYVDHKLYTNLDNIIKNRPSGYLINTYCFIYAENVCFYGIENNKKFRIKIK